MRMYFAILLLFLTCALPARGEIYNCDGRWTNVPCEGAPQKAIDESKRKVLSPAEAMQASEKRSLLHELTMKKLRAREDYGFDADTGYAEKLCTDAAVSLERCRRAVMEADERLSDRMAQFELIHEQRRANELQEERNRRQTESAAATVIIERTPVIYDLERRPEVNVNQQVVVEQHQQQVVRPLVPRRTDRHSGFGRARAPERR